MAGRQAKFISATELTRALKLIRSRPNATRDEAILLLSVRRRHDLGEQLGLG